MRMLACVVLAAVLGACADQVNQNPGMQTVDVDPSGTSTCPAQLFELSSDGLAQCTHAPEACDSTPGATMLHCTCNPSGSSSTGTWVCGSVPPYSDGGAG